MERFVTNARHVEVQIVGDGTGKVLHFGERDCTVQRRYQKLIEEAPASALPEATRQKLHAAAVQLTSQAKYRGAGTVEFLYDIERDDFYFMEVNSRIQVEHPVTEQVTGVDLIALQLRVGGGEGLGLTQNQIKVSGHAIEVRINAEDPARNFQPSPGRITLWQAPQGEGVRIDTHAHQGYLVPPYYDSMIGKLIVTGKDRADALQRMVAALAQFKIEGPASTLGLAARIVQQVDFQSNQITTRWLETEVLPRLAST
jgi:acetyl-CoA carboxylase, biotin carboxylase subunit